MYRRSFRRVYRFESSNCVRQRGRAPPRSCSRNRPSATPRPRPCLRFRRQESQHAFLGRNLLQDGPYSLPPLEGATDPRIASSRKLRQSPPPGPLASETHVSSSFSYTIAIAKV